MKFSVLSSSYRLPLHQNFWLAGGIITFVGVWFGSLVSTNDFSNWLLENLLVFLFVGTLAFTYRKYRFSDLSYSLIAVYLILHVHGSMYTYADAPLGHWLSEILGWQRNNFDRIVHFCFGFLLAYPMRELLLRVVKTKAWVAWVLPAEVTLSFSGLYEIIEWLVADLFFPEQGPAYLGTQGDVWDAQKDMALAFFGSILILLLVFACRSIHARVKR